MEKAPLSIEEKARSSLLMGGISAFIALINYSQFATDFFGKSSFFIGVFLLFAGFILSLFAISRGFGTKPFSLFNYLSKLNTAKKEGKKNELPWPREASFGLLGIILGIIGLVPPIFVFVLLFKKMFLIPIFYTVHF